MVTVVHDIQVSSVLYQSDNGAICKANILQPDGSHTGEKINIALPGKIANNDFQLFKGQVFKVAGILSNWPNKRTGSLEPQIKVKKLIEIRAKGSNFVAYISGNNSFRGIGTTTASALWSRFGGHIFDLIESCDIETLMQVDGVTKTKAETLIDSWKNENKADVINWLEIHRLPVWLGRKLVATYENETIIKIDADPYRLLSFSVSWKKVDTLAREYFSIKPDDPRRLHAAVTEALYGLYDEGHTAAEQTTLTERVGALIGAELVPAALRREYINGGFVRTGDNLYQSRGAYLQERFVVHEIRARCGNTQTFNHSSSKLLRDYNNSDTSLTEEQQEAVLSALVRPFSIITGGAGVGKTSVLRELHTAIESIGGQTIQMALSGRAAKRMKETTGRHAITIANFLLTASKASLRDISHIVIDEASMLDLPQTVSIFRKLLSKHRIILVGDPAQLPPVGPGKILQILASRTDIPVSRLTKIFRQSRTSGIPAVSGLIRNGEWPVIGAFTGKKDGVTFIPADRKNINSIVLSVYETLGGTSAAEDVRILCPTNADKPWGTIGLNKELSQKYTDQEKSVLIDGNRRTPVDTRLNIGDLVLATRNNWDKEVMNGSLGRVIRFATKQEIKDETHKGNPAPVILVEFDHGPVLIDKDDIRHLTWGYAITCHKAQGSQFRRVIIPLVLPTLLDRTLIYTAITRGINQVVFVGNEDVIRKAVECETNSQTRTVGLDYLLTVHNE